MGQKLITSFLLATIICSITCFAAAQSSASLPLDPNLGIKTMPVWDGHIPEVGGAPKDIPTLTMFLPLRPNGTAVIVVPGGGYTMLASNHEGRQVADWFAARGITAFVLKYRIGPHNLLPLTLEDAQRAIRLVRYDARKLHILPDRIGIIGFSAGGHLAALTGTLFHQGDASSSDPVDRFSDRPDFMILGYAWLNAMEPNSDGKITYCSVLKIVPEADCKQFEKNYTPARHVTVDTPPTFI